MLRYNKDISCVTILINNRRYFLWENLFQEVIMNNNLTVTADLINDKVKFSGVSRDNHEIMIDSMSPIANDNGYTPIELFLLSLATCSGMTIILLLRKMHKNVLGLKVIASGDRRDTPPTYFKSIPNLIYCKRNHLFLFTTNIQENMKINTRVKQLCFTM